MAQMAWAMEDAEWYFGLDQGAKKDAVEDLEFQQQPQSNVNEVLNNVYSVTQKFDSNTQV